MAEYTKINWRKNHAMHNNLLNWLLPEIGKLMFELAKQVALPLSRPSAEAIDDLKKWLIGQF